MLLLKILGCVWATPITVLGLIYVLTFWARGWYRWYGTYDVTLVWATVPEKMPKWLTGLWENPTFDVAGHSIANVIVIDTNDFRDLEAIKTTMKHEAQHARQCMILGVFQPITYLLMMLVIMAACRTSHPYYSNPYEIDARRAAGQLIDVEGELRRRQQEKAGGKHVGND